MVKHQEGPLQVSRGQNLFCRYLTCSSFQVHWIAARRCHLGHCCIRRNSESSPPADHSDGGEARRFARSGASQGSRTDPQVTLPPVWPPACQQDSEKGGRQHCAGDEGGPTGVQPSSGQDCHSQQRPTLHPCLSRFRVDDIVPTTDGGLVHLLQSERVRFNLIVTHGLPAGRSQ